MKFLVDENTGVFVARWLREQGYEVFSVYEQAKGIDDETIIQKAFNEHWILITSDKDFRDKVYRDKSPHHGVIFLRLENERYQNKIYILQHLLDKHIDELLDNFVVVSETQIRFAKIIQE